jgi:hypothetical protein
LFGADGNNVGDHCTEARPCGGGQAAHWAYALNSVSGVGLGIVTNALLAGGISIVAQGQRAVEVQQNLNWPARR